MAVAISRNSFPLTHRCPDLPKTGCPDLETRLAADRLLAWPVAPDLVAAVENSWSKAVFTGIRLKTEDTEDKVGGC